ncbi:MAG: SpoIIE family protein phosphatase, partial [Planctomycetes bacterium]|nr:SpoIIE family protein phosphatase [Planctomycetota bacterium]
MDDARLKIVLLDDNMATLNQVKNLLQDLYRVYTVQSPSIFFENLEHHLPDLILLDVEMPEMNGFEVIRKLKADARYKDIPVIFLTVKSDEESEREGFRLGAADYVTKPISGPLLQKRISNQLLYKCVQAALTDHSSILEALVDELTKVNQFLTDTAAFKDLDGNPSGFVEVMRDVSEIRKMTQIIQKSVEQLQHREMLTTALNKAATTFLSQNEESFEKIMVEGMQPIAQTVNVNKLLMWRNDLRKDGLHLKQTYRWSDQESGANGPPMESTDALYSQLVPHWEGLLANDNAINSPIRLLPEAKVLKPLGAKSVFVAPIFVHDAFWGVALFADVHHERYFDNDCAEMLRSAAFLLASTVIRTEQERVDSELRVARQIQFSLVPNIFPPYSEWREFDLHAILSPANEIGGDYYDFFFLDSNRLVAVVGDVSGNGVPAALYMAVCRTAFRTLARGASNPGDLLTRLNDHLVRDHLSSGLYITIACFFIELSTGRCEYALAGHPAPLLHRLSADIIEGIDNPRETFIGMKPGVSFPTGEVKMERGDTLLLYTDGVSDARNDMGDE